MQSVMKADQSVGCAVYKSSFCRLVISSNLSSFMVSNAVKQWNYAKPIGIKESKRCGAGGLGIIRDKKVGKS